MDAVAHLNGVLAGRYTVEREIGAGGMAAVYLAHDLKHDRKVALKLLNPQLASEVGAERFLHEIRVTARLAHPNILPLLDSGELDGLPYYVMPFVAGESLRDRLNHEPMLPVDLALQIAGEVADALAYAHAQGVLHRDIKPENILLQGGHAVVTDFGIARAVSEAGGERLTRSGVSVGTPTYMSPEQATGEERLDARTDQYSLACVLYETLVGEPPITGPTIQSVVARKCSQTPPPVHTSRDSVPPAVDRAIARALARLPADRFPSVDEFRRALSSSDAARRVPRRAVVAGVAIAVAATLLVVVLPLRRTPAPKDGPPRVAVLPFEYTGPAEYQYVADGLTEEITSRLAGISGLRTPSRTSAKRFRGSSLSMRQIGDSLGVDYILEGSVRTDRAGNGSTLARVTAQVIRARSDESMWHDEFPATLSTGDLFRVQDSIATAVANAMNVALTDPEKRRVARVPTTDSAAYRLYQMGRFQWEKRDGESLLRAADYFRQAIARDPNFAKAYAGLADALNIHHELFTPENESEGTAAIDAARHAIALDGTLAEAYATLGFALTLIKWDWAGADSAFRRSIALDPGYAPAEYWYAQLLSITGRDADGMRMAMHATELDPLSSIAHLVYGLNLFRDGRLNEATSELQRAADLQPTAWINWQYLTMVRVRSNRLSDARSAAFQYLTRLLPGQSVDSTMTAEVLTMFSGRADAVTASRFVGRIGARDNSAVAALWFGIGGVPDSAFRYLRTAIERHNAFTAIPVFWLQPVLENDPRWADVVRSVGLAAR